ncbi:MAG TPA: ribulose-phosphate 3-epimerase [Gammaproteobacteria bacterium]|jgi:ribulose-phosphate 3-epimerase|nr:ribulose-phosphate 3-epimerase [Gammaproteobacteria bacterium]HJP43065.1 ribulose-phosphate 3-epimerase [Gammaproteobacteria bacterium]
MADYQIAPSILSADFSCLGEEVEMVLDAGADIIHFDVMDNHYVPNLTVGPVVCKALRNFGIEAPIDVHLMVSPVDDLVVSFAEAGATYISFHPEASENIDATIQLIKKHDCKPGLAINPDTSLDCLDDRLGSIDLVVIMSVYPGFAGQSFIQSSLQKLEGVRESIIASGKPILLEIDGGIKANNIRDVAQHGADVFVSGSGIFGTENYRKTIEHMRAELSKV